MFQFERGTKVSIAFNKMPDEERVRFKKAECRIDQPNHQTEAQTGTILEQRVGESGIQYLVKVDVKNSPTGRQRVIAEDKLTSL